MHYPGNSICLSFKSFFNQPTQIPCLQSNWGQPGAGTTDCYLIRLLLHLGDILIYRRTLQCGNQHVGCYYREHQNSNDVH